MVGNATAPFQYKTANASSRDKCPEQFGFGAEDANLGRTDGLNAQVAGSRYLLGS
jgi:hypothetical protein